MLQLPFSCSHFEKHHSRLAMGNQHEPRRALRQQQFNRLIQAITKALIHLSKTVLSRESGTFRSRDGDSS
jgi:3-methyladenine DNA glycosylase/8-oxoguanine DNA glycosylase